MEKVTIVLVLAILSTAQATLETYKYEAHYGEHSVAYEDVKLDRKEQYAIIEVTPVYGDLIPTINFHDFMTRFLAIKDDKHETCYIFRTDKTIKGMLSTFEKSVEENGFLAITESYRCTSKRVIENEDLADNYGERIADFCADYLVIQSEKTFSRRTARATKFVSGNIMGCGICGWSQC